MRIPPTTSDSGSKPIRPHAATPMAITTASTLTTRIYDAFAARRCRNQSGHERDVHVREAAVRQAVLRLRRCALDERERALVVLIRGRRVLIGGLHANRVRTVGHDRALTILEVPRDGHRLRVARAARGRDGVDIVGARGLPPREQILRAYV